MSVELYSPVVRFLDLVEARASSDGFDERSRAIPVRFDFGDDVAPKKTPVPCS